MTTRPGLILFAHGARDPRWAAPFEAVLARVRAARPGADVRLAFLELMTPDLPTAIDELQAAGCRTIEVMPMFLGTGGHLRRDLPALLAQVRERHPALTITLHAAVGEQPDVIEAMAQAAAATLRA